MNKGIRAYAAEFIGTFILVFGGTSAILGNSLLNFGDSAGVIIPLAFGLSLVVGIFALGHISGAHFNPAVTLAFAVGRKDFSWGDVPGYLIGQLGGAALAATVLSVCFGGAEGFTTGPTTPNTINGVEVSTMAVATFEFLATFILMFVIMAVATDARVQGVPAGLAIGFTVAAMALGTGWVGGGSFNPARSFGPALVGGVWTQHWLYWVFPILGAICAVFAYDFVRGPQGASSDPVMRDPTAG